MNNFQVWDVTFFYIKKAVNGTLVLIVNEKMHWIYSALFKNGIFPKINKIKLVFCECAMVPLKHFVAGETMKTF
jgi:hypothetical protein